MTWKDFCIYREARYRNDLKEWERFRFIGHLIFSANSDKKSWKPITEWFPLPIDEKEERRKLNDEEVEKIVKRMTIK